MKFHLAYLTSFALIIASGTTSADVLDGSRAGDSYGAAKSVQTVQTQFGDNASELNAGYATASIADGMLRLLFTGNLEGNFNKFNIFIDSRAGGQNTIGANTANGGVNSAANSDNIFTKYSTGAGPGFTFDTGFNADYVLISRQGDGNKFDLNFLSIGNALVAEETTNIFGGTNTGANASVGASGIGVGFDNSNVAGITGGTGAADATAAQAVLTGLEYWIPLSAIGNPGLGSTILISAHVNGSNHDFLSNQSLGGFAPPQVNLGGDGAGNFTGDLSQINLNSFAGNQFFSVVVAIPEPSSMVLLGMFGLGLVTRRRRAC